MRFDVTNVFAVVGQHRVEPGRLLLLGDDGRYYAYAADGLPARIEPSAAWTLDADGRPARGEAPVDVDPGPALRANERRRSRRVAGQAGAGRSLAIVFLLLVGLVSAPPALAEAPALAIVTAVAALRAAPDGTAPVLAAVPSGTEVELSGAAAGDFLEVLAAGTRGWVPVDRLDDGRLDTAAVPAGAVVRAAPRADGDALVPVPAGATVILTGATVDGYAAVSFEGVGGWVAGGEVSPLS